MLRSSDGPGSRLFLMPSSMALSSTVAIRCGFTMESTARYSKRPGAETRNPVVRFWKPQSAKTGAQKPVFADWGFQNRTTGLRVSAPGRFEYRAVDSMVNPHLMATVLLKAMDDGIRNNLDPGPSEERNIYQAMEAGKQVKKLPMTLGDALAALEKDEVIRSAMPGDMYRLYDEYKRDEWERFNYTVTEWDLETYLDCLP